MCQRMKPVVYVWVLTFLFVGGQSEARTITVGLEPGYDFADIQAAIDAASDADVILVVDGTYTGPGNRDIDFHGRAITVRSINGPDYCRIDCRGQGRGVLFHSGEEETSVFDGFAIAHGSAEMGGGICCTEMSSPTISNCVFEENEADHGGGGMYISAAKPTLMDCVFIANRATCYRVQDDEGYRTIRACGGAILNDSSFPTIHNCHFSENIAMGRGGAVCNLGAVASMTDSVFTANDANDTGGAVCNMEQSTVIFLECTFQNNGADNDGGGIHNFDSTTTAQHCTFSDNVARQDDGGAVASFHSTLTLEHCTFQQNWAREDGGALADFDSNDTNVTNCRFCSNSVDEDGGAIYAWETNIRLTACTFTENTADDDGGAMYHRRRGSSSVTDCLFSGNIARDNGGAMFNRNNCNPELLNCVFSDNFARSTGGAIYNRDNCSPTLTNCLLSRNAANDSGGALCNRDNSHPTFLNCTIADNSATFETGGILNRDNCRPQLTNCIVWGNDDESGMTQQAQLCGGVPTVDSCCIQAYSGNLAGSNNIAEDPVFVTGPWGDYYLSQAATGQADTSPCVDMGADLPADVSLIGFTTRTDHAEDSAAVDVGYHHPAMAPPDLNADGRTDFYDFAILSARWLTEGCITQHHGDSNGDHTIDIRDLQTLFDNWLVVRPAS